MEGKAFPTLYKKNSKGKIQYWNISVLPNSDHSVGYDICVAHGIEGGKEQEAWDTILEGKNIGKVNETSPKQQALLEAEAKWVKQQDRKGYVQNKEDLDKDLRPGAEAMLAHRYDKYPDKIEFPCYLQPKLDGHRCIAVVKDGKCELFSRQRKPITGLPHIVEAIEAMGLQNIILDGELYNHAYKDNFEELTGFIRSQKPKPGYAVVQYHLYDVVLEANYVDRLVVLGELQNLNKSDSLRFVTSKSVTKDSVVVLFKEYRAAGYEGAMLRNKNGHYEGKRSYNLQKVKEFDDAEFPIVDVEEGRGAMKGHAIFVCETPEGKSFKAKMKGPMEQLKVYFEQKQEYIGKIITVQFQEYSKDGIPRFPVAVRFREDV